MSSELTPEDVSKVAQLAMLNLTEEEVATHTPQLCAILDLAGQMDAFDLDGIEPVSHPHGLTNVYRSDEVEHASVTSRVLQCAPESEATQFRVPPVLGEER